MKYHIYTSSSEAWDAMLSSIKKAKKSIYWECYILLNDTPMHNFFDVLKEKAQQGLKVKIIADAMGSYWLKSQIQRDLLNAGIDILFFNHRGWFYRNHKKILIVDEEIGFVGGVNIAERFKHWLDLHVELRGLIVQGLLRSFIKSYRHCGGVDNLIMPKIKSSKRKISILNHWPLQKRKKFLKKYYLYHLANARQSIIIATPYFAPHLWLIRALHKSNDRGIKIDIILPKKSDSRLIDWASYIFMFLVRRPGIDFYFVNEMIHAKSLLVDDQEGMIGSNNIDAQSFDYNVEGGIVFQRKDMLSDLKDILDNWKRNAKKFDFNKIKKGWGQRILEIIFGWLQPIL